tara:strand:+ start:4378 stop:4674 length:297 start_codon:yes stop_codon:yes gene_type:complete
MLHVCTSWKGYHIGGRREGEGEIGDTAAQSTTRLLLAQGEGDEEGKLLQTKTLSFFSNTLNSISFSWPTYTMNDMSGMALLHIDSLLHTWGYLPCLIR